MLRQSTGIASTNILNGTTDLTYEQTAPKLCTPAQAAYLNIYQDKRVRETATDVRYKWEVGADEVKFVTATPVDPVLAAPTPAPAIS